ncbi:TNF receptor-associated factor 6-like isoform X1 [Dermacentor silvarum]|uniref:TNF receptor-associated factor 6-like isoform X1 n=1 Tax=Dermacentor silvarum TaxID=543639 RepID=UPI00189AA336|nr:TNF receptor-associated factor 6-like isoform X1 [Dermacentor silvarum]
MASRGQRYTLCGFSQELDWRPLHFVERIPENKICNACGVLPSITAFLPCKHVLCRSCYEHCRLDNSHACPLDGDQFLAEDAEWINFPLDNLLRRKVKCWNAEQGCGMVLVASEQIKHFCEDCDYHFSSCPNCSKVVLRRDVCAHLQSKCRDYALSAASRSPHRTDSESKAMIMALNASMDMQEGEMKDRLDQVISDNSGQSDRLNEISHFMNSIKEILLQISSKALENVASQAPATISRREAIQQTLIEHSKKLQELAQTTSNSNKAQMKALEDTKHAVEQLKGNTANMLQAELRQRSVADCAALRKVSDRLETFEKLLEDSTKAICRNISESAARIGEGNDGAEQSWSSATKLKELALNTINIRRYEFFVKGLKAMKYSTHSTGYHIYKCENMYMSGYHLSPGVHLKKVGEHVLLCARMQLHKGVIDEFLPWPFNEKIQLTVKHPSRQKHYQLIEETGDLLGSYGRPQQSSNSGVCFMASSVRLDDLKREGYVADDNLQIVWELVPKDLPKQY